jgi:hypothetical protein
MTLEYASRGVSRIGRGCFQFSNLSEKCVKYGISEETHEKLNFSNVSRYVKYIVLI